MRIAIDRLNVPGVSPAVPLGTKNGPLTSCISSCSGVYLMMTSTTRASSSTPVMYAETRYHFTAPGILGMSRVRTVRAMPAILPSERVGFGGEGYLALLFLLALPGVLHEPV